MPALRVKPSYYARAYALPRGICACAVGLCTVLEWRGMAEASAEDLEIESVPATPPSCDRPESSRASILDRLKPPAKSDLARKRKIEKPKTTGADKKRKSSVPSPSDPKTVSPSTRAKEFPGECLEVRQGKLFCAACREELSLKKSTVKNHISSGNKHSDAKARLARKEARERDIAQSLVAHDKEEQPAGTSVSMAERVYRVKVVENFLRAGIPLSKIDTLRALLEENGLRLTHSSHLADYIPLLLRQENELIRSELEDECISAVFDGTTRDGEALAIVVRFVKDWKIEQRLVRLLLLAKPVTGDELARELLTVLSTELGVANTKLLACTRDRAAVNGKAMRTLGVLYPNVMDIGCFSHTLDLVGENFKTPTLEKFMKHWVKLFQHSYKARLIWREKTGQAPKHYSATRWWSKWECENQIMLQWGDVPGFLESADAAPKSREKLKRLLECDKTNLMTELAVTIDAGAAFVKACYTLEGDGPLVLTCYEVLSTVKASIQVQHWPNTHAVARQLAAQQKQPALEQQLITYAKSCVQPGFTYFESKFDGELLPCVKAFKAASFFHPGKVTDRQPNASAIEELKAFPFLQGVIPDLKTELPTYLATAEGTPADVELLKWWKKHAEKLPHWAAACKQVLLCQPSSAAVERVFSCLKNSFNDQQSTV